MEKSLFAKNIRFLREGKNLLQGEMPANIGIHRTTWSNYENSVSEPNIAGLINIAEFFEVSLNDLLLADLEDAQLNTKSDQNVIRKHIKSGAISNEKVKGIDPRYADIKFLIHAGRIGTIRDIFRYIPKTTVYKDLGVNFNRFSRAIGDPSIFRLKELAVLAKLFGIEPKILINLAYEQFLTLSRNKLRVLAFDLGKDSRYSDIKLLIKEGRINSIRDIFNNIPKTTVFKDLGVNFNRFTRAINDPSIFKFYELATIAELIGVDAKKIIDMAYYQMISKFGKPRKKYAN